MKVHIKAGSKEEVEAHLLPTYREFLNAMYEREVNNDKAPMDALFGKVKAAKERAAKVTPKGNRDDR